MSRELKFDLTVDAGKAIKAIDTTRDGLVDLGELAEKTSKTTLKLKTDTKQVTKAQREVRGLGDTAKTTGAAFKQTAAAGASVKLNPQAAAQARALSTAADAAANSTQRLAKAAASIPTKPIVAAESATNAASLAGAVKTLLPAVQQLGPALTAASVAGMALSGGMSRLKAIDNAKSKLKGLGHDTQAVAAIMKDALGSVKGTAFGLGEAASTAAGTVAAGIKPGKELATTLGTVADTAAIAGASMQEIGMIFNSVAARGKLQGDDMLQLLSRGIPVLQLIGKQLGVTSAEVSDMVSKGQVDFATFEAAMRDGMGGAAKEMGNTFAGAAANTKAALGRLGAEILNPAFQALPGILGSATSATDSLTDSVKRATGFMQGLPAPVQQVALAATAAALANATLGKRFDATNTKLASAAKGAQSWAQQLRATATQLQAANAGLTRHEALIRSVTVTSPRLKALEQAYLGATMGAARMGAEAGRSGLQLTLMSRSAGVAAVGMAGLKAAATGLWTALGGPLGLAITGVTLALGAWLGHVEKTKQAQAEAAAATDRWAQAFQASNNLIDANIHKLAVQEAQTGKLGDAITAGALTTEQAARAIENEGDARKKILDALDEEIKAREKANAANVVDYGSDADKEIEKLKAARDAIEAQGKAFDEGRTKAEQAADAIGKLGESSASISAPAYDAAERTRSLAEQLYHAADEAKNFEDAIKRTARALNAEFNGTTLDMQQEIGEFYKQVEELSKKSAGLDFFNSSTGQFDMTQQAARDTLDVLRSTQNEMSEAVAARMEQLRNAGSQETEVIEVARQEWEKYRQSVVDSLTAAGRSADEIQAVMKAAGFDQPLNTLVKVQVQGDEDASKALEILGDKALEFDNKKHELHIAADIPAHVQKQLEDLHLKVEKLPDGKTLAVKADPQNAATTRTLDSIRRQMMDIPEAKNISVDLRARTDDVVAKLNEIGYQASVMEPAEFPIIADTEEARQAIHELGLAAESMPDGEILIRDYTPENMDRLRQLGADVLNLPQGNIVIEDRTGEKRRALEDLGLKITTLPEGEIVIHDNAEVVRNKIDSLLSPAALSKVATITLNAAGSFFTRLTGHATGGRIPTNAEGSRIPANADGSRIGGPAGYRLPTTGPGTERVDGFLGVGKDGIPTTWVDKGEWVINGRSSERFDTTLAAINHGDPSGVLAGLAKDLPRLADGGKADDVLSALRPWEGTPYRLGGWGSDSSDCTGAVSMAANVADGRDPLDGRGATANFAEFLASRGFEPGLGGPDDFSVGWYHNSGTDGHAAATIGGHRLESGGGTGGGLHIDGPATGADDPQFTQHMHRKLEYTGDGGATAAGSDGGSPGFVRSFVPVATNTNGGVYSGAVNIPGLANNTAAPTLGEAFATHPAMQTLRDAGLGDIVDQMGKLKLPTLDVLLYVNEDTIAAFNKLGEAEDDRAEAAYNVAEAEKALAEARKQVGKTDTEWADKIAEARKDLEKAKTPDKKGKVDSDKVEKAQKKLDKMLAEAPEKAEKASEKVVQAERKLAKARMEETQKVAALERARMEMDIAKAIAPAQAFNSVMGSVANGFKKAAEQVARLNELHAYRRQVEERFRAAALDSARAQVELTDALIAQQDAARTAASERAAANLKVREAEYDLSRARQAAYDYERRSATEAIVSVEDASNRKLTIADNEAQALKLESLARLARAQEALTAFDAAMLEREATTKLVYAQEAARIQALRLAQESVRLAEAQNSISYGGEEAGGLMGWLDAMGDFFGGVGKTVLGAVKVGVGGMLTTTGAGALVGVPLAASGLADIGTGLTNTVKGWQTMDANSTDAYNEFGDLSLGEKVAVVLAAAGAPVSGAATALAESMGVDHKTAEEFGDGLGGIPRLLLEGYLSGNEAKRAVDERHAALQERENAKAENANELRRLEEEKAAREKQLSIGATLKDRVAELTREVEENTFANRKSTDALTDATSAAGGGRGLVFSLGGGTWFDPTRSAMDAYQADGGFGGVGIGGTLAEQGASWSIDDGGYTPAAPSRLLTNVRGQQDSTSRLESAITATGAATLAAQTEATEATVASSGYQKATQAKAAEQANTQEKMLEALTRIAGALPTAGHKNTVPLARALALATKSGALGTMVMEAVDSVYPDQDTTLTAALARQG
ncbi:hypothetical protein C1Y63_04695 [Corynebacterium sp. 13CS0277]|uniref:tape measure protein n=1 Tax=Corynebacterium sp. 13CS0277 TaxID=2071994 RepID=UPI000D039E4B|nr:tape measure protein [Corynebacterium sp. 13CS0277]PRQ11710.1 hypothetical protein C1Y63_04695 [Corynebacterium sp. 13CS0277]